MFLVPSRANLYVPLFSPCKPAYVLIATMLALARDSAKPGRRREGQRGEKWEKVGNWTRVEKRGRIPGVLRASLSLLAQEDPQNEVRLPGRRWVAPSPERGTSLPCTAPAEPPRPVRRRTGCCPQCCQCTADRSRCALWGPAQRWHDRSVLPQCYYGACTVRVQCCPQR
eukprot:1176727-Prorocentrum_minimum.AAC.1